MIIPKAFYGLLLFCFFIFYVQSLQDACQSKETLSMIDISNSRILKNTVYEYKIENFDTSTNFTRNDKGEVILNGNFSKLTLVNKALQKEYTYLGKQIILRVPSTHFYAKNKSAQAQLQIIYELDGTHQQNRHKVVTMTQLYLVSKYPSKMGVNLCKELNRNDKYGSVFRTSNLLKIMEKMPVLMYQGSKNIYPCRNDVLCMVRKEFAQITEEDLQCLKEKMKIQTFKQIKKTKFFQKNLFEVAQLSEDNDL